MTMRDKLALYCQLMRFDRPIGILLLLWPTLWAVWLGGHGSPKISIIIIFILGVILMRAAGCVINDIADRHFDPHVDRTSSRPLATKKIPVKQAFILFIGLCVLASSLLIFLNSLCFYIALAALVLPIAYPFMKRITHLPQLILGIAWSLGILMAFAAQENEIPLTGWLLYIATLSWTVAFDTMYAMVDRNDDIKIGIKSTAILFAHSDRYLIGLFQLLTMILLSFIGQIENLPVTYYLFLSIAGLTMVYQQFLIFDRTPKKCLHAFRNNSWFGAWVFLGLLFSYIV